MDLLLQRLIMRYGSFTRMLCPQALCALQVAVQPLQKLHLEVPECQASVSAALPWAVLQSIAELLQSCKTTLTGWEVPLLCL